MEVRALKRFDDMFPPPGGGPGQPRRMASFAGGLGELRGFLRMVGTRWGLFWGAVALSGIGTFFTLAEIRLLLLLLQSMISPGDGLAAGGGVAALLVRPIMGLIGGGHAALLAVVFLLLATVLIQTVFSYLSAVTVNRQVRDAKNNVRGLLFERYLAFGKLFFDRTSLSLLNTVLMNDTDVVAGRVKSLQQLLSQGLALLLYGLLLLAIDVRLTLLTCVLLPLVMLSAGWLVRWIWHLARHTMATRGRLDERIFNILSCIPLVQAENYEGEEQQIFADVSEREAAAAARVTQIQELAGPLHHVASVAILFGLALFISATTSADNAAKMSGYFVFFIVVLRMAASLGQMGRSVNAIAKTGPTMKRIRDMLDDRDKHIVADGPRDCPGLRESIVFRHLDFGYRLLRTAADSDGTGPPKKGLVLRDFNLTLREGQVTALVGPSGAGKTTVLNLLLRFYDCSPGSIFIDGVDIREFSVASVRDLMTYVGQDVQLFNDTLRANISYGLGEGLSDEDIMAVAKRAKLDHVIQLLPRGLDAVIGDRGVQLSGGEKQRVCIARALLKDRPILLLDEATSALDSETETDIQDAVAAAAKGRTVVVIAHRISTVKNADVIAVIERGRVVEQGTLAELIEREGVFHGLWSAQIFE